MLWFRVLLSICMFLSVFLLPWWVVVVFAGVLFLFFAHPFEALIAGILLDLLYGSGGGTLVNTHILFTASFLIVWYFLTRIKPFLRIEA